MNLLIMKARERRRENMRERLTVLSLRSVRRFVAPSRSPYMVIEQPMATGRVRKMMIVARGRMPIIENAAIQRKGNMAVEEI